MPEQQPTTTHPNQDFEGTTINTQINLEANRVMTRCNSILSDIMSKYPEWGALYEDTDPFSAPQAQLLELIESAPNDAARMLVYGFYHARVEIAAMTGRPFR